MADSKELRELKRFPSFERTGSRYAPREARLSVKDFLDLCRAHRLKPRCSQSRVGVTDWNANLCTFGVKFGRWRVMAEVSIEPYTRTRNSSIVQALERMGTIVEDPLDVECEPDE